MISGATVAAVEAVAMTASVTPEVEAVTSEVAVVRSKVVVVTSEVSAVTSEVAAVMSEVATVTPVVGEGGSGCEWKISGMISWKGELFFSLVRKLLILASP